MAAFTRVNPDTFYVNGVAIPASYFAAVDGNQVAALDGDAGNATWSPASGLAVAGAGMWCAGPWDLSTGAICVSFTSAAPLTHSDSDYIGLANGHPIASRTLVTPCSVGRDASGCSAVTGGVIAGTTAIMAPDYASMGMVNAMVSAALAAAAANTGNINAQYRSGGRVLVPLRVHNGALLTSATFYFVIAPHASLPAVMPQFRIHKVSLTAVLTPLKNVAGTTTGFQSLPRPGNAAAYVATTSYTYNVNAGSGPGGNDIIDTSAFSYFAEIVDESGNNAVAGNVFAGVALNFTSIPDMRPQ